MPTKVTFVGVKDAAELLRVSPNTIRAWGASGKLIEHRHPVNNYRLYKAKDLERLVAQSAGHNRIRITTPGSEVSPHA